jgi:hypothetical protein
MTKKTGRNEPCDCGSGKKYKKCCLVNPKPQKSLYEKLMTEDTHAFARIISKDGESSSMEISHTSVTKNGVTTILQDEVISLSTNTIQGDNTEEASAMLSIPIDLKSSSKILTSGNATVLNGQEHFVIQIIDNQKKLSLKSTNGLFASIKVSNQKDSNFNYLTILFGVKGQKEFINEDGRKNRSDIALYPSGNGKFIRLSDNVGEFDPTWTFENNLTYDPSEKTIYPSQILISSSKYSEKLTLKFEFDSSKKTVVLTEGTFE